MSVRIMTAAWAVDLPAGDKLVLLALADCANDEGHCWPGVRSLCVKTGKGERSLQASLKALESAEQITRDQVPGKGCNYTIHPQPVLSLAPRRKCAPAKSAPPQKLPLTPAKSAGKPSRTIPSEAKASSGNSTKFVLPADIPAEPFDAFVEMRAKMGKRMTDHAKHLAVLRLRKLRDDDGWPPGDVLNNSTLNSYQGLFPPKDDRHGRQSGTSKIRATLDLLGARH